MFLWILGFIGLFIVVCLMGHFVWTHFICRAQVDEQSSNIWKKLQAEEEKHEKSGNKPKLGTVLETTDDERM